MLVGIVLVIISFVFRFGRGFGEFARHAEKHDDFLELRRLDIIFGLFTAAGIILILMCPVAVYAVIRQRPYAAAVAIMVVVQLIVGLMSFTYSDEINQLEADDLLFKSANRTMDYWTQHGGVKPPQRQEDIDTEFWTVTQRTLKCCGVTSYKDWLLWTNRTEVLEEYECHAENYDTGCGHEIRHRVATDATFVGISAIAVLVFEVFHLVLLLKTIKPQPTCICL
ncbi:unnamed protein product [Enterobius vermicularis]|uniref:Tetraspanin n=1 Tax=Enterobius vermicularis TaxID=51028 RepID=A0A0N4VG94_ENTVE|nr:unnamed protein product [Enterobius vermicularis]